MRVLFLIIVLTLTGATGIARVVAEPSYDDTRSLLAKLTNDHGNPALRKLFAEAHKRRKALLRALDDPDPRIQISAVRVIDLVALPELTTGLLQWLKSLEGTDRVFGRPNLDPIDARLAARGFQGEPARVTKRDLFGNQRGSYRVVARNKEAKTVLVEVIFGEVFTEGWHVVLRRDGSEWRVLVKSNVWVS